MFSEEGSSGVVHVDWIRWIPGQAQYSGVVFSSQMNWNLDRGGSKEKKKLINIALAALGLVL